jgi:hypothetical protein
MFFHMPFKIISPTGNTVTKTLSEEQVGKLKAGKYFTIVPMVRVSISDSVCTSCEG